MKGSDYNVSRYIIDRFIEVGLRHIFGIPGDYVLDFIDEIIDCPIKYVGNCLPIARNQMPLSIILFQAINSSLRSLEKSQLIQPYQRIPSKPLTRSIESLRTLYQKLPVYLEIPADIALKSCIAPKGSLGSAPIFSDEDTLTECLSEVR